MTNVNTSAASTDSSSAAPAGKTVDSTPNIEAFYSPKEPVVPGPKVSLWITHKTQHNSPDLDGTIGETRVAGYVHQGPKGKFISFIDSKAGKDEKGHYKQVATGRVICGSAGIPNLSLSIVDVAGDQWANSSKKVPQEFMVHLGLNEEDQATKKAAYTARKAAEQAAEQPVAA